MGIYEKCMEFKNRTGRWPRTKIIIYGKRYNKKELLALKDEFGEMIDEFLEEYELSYKWRRSDEYKLMVGNIDKEIEEFPKKYQDMISTLRSMGLGFSRKRSDIVSHCEKFYNKYGRVPGRVTKEQAINSEKRLERKLYQYLSQNGIRKILEDYVTMEIEEIPEVHQDMVRRFRAIGMGVKRTKPTNVKDYIDFVAEKRREPVFYVEPKNELQEVESGIRHKWRMSKVHEIYVKYQGYFIEEVPEEYRAIVQKIRKLWLKIDGNRVADEVIEYINKNQREPREININFKQFENGLTMEEQREKELNEKWNRCFEKHVIDRFVGVPITRIPENYRAIVSKMREVGLGHPESLNTRLFIKYALKHGRKPRQVIFKDGKRAGLNICSDEEKKEIAIRRRWDFSEDREVYNMYLQGILDEEAIKFYSNMLHDLDKVTRAENLKMKKKTSTTTRKNLKKAQKTKVEKQLETEDLGEKLKEEKKQIQKVEEPKVEQEEIPKVEEEHEVTPKVEGPKVEQEEIPKAEEQKVEQEKRPSEEKQMDETVTNEKAEQKKASKAEKEQEIIQIAKDFIGFIKENGRTPKTVFRVKGVDIKVDNLTDSMKEEKLLRQSFDKSRFVDIIEEYVGVPVENIPANYQSIVADFRDIGMGLTYDEYEKFRETRDPKTVLISAKATREWELKKKNRVKAFAKEVRERVGKQKGKEQDDG